MSRTNVAVKADPIYTHEGGKATRCNEEQELRRSVLTCLLWEDNFYESGSTIAARIASLVPKVPPQVVHDIAIEAREVMQLRHAPLFLLRELARVKGAGRFVESGLARVIQRADELAEYLALYWKDKRQPLSAGSKRGLAEAFTKFSAYALGKYNRDNKIKLRDVLFLAHAKPRDTEQAVLWKSLIDGTLASPDTWEVELSAGKDKKETFTRLLREKKLGGLAVLRNLRNMLQAGVDEGLIRKRLREGCGRALPFRFITAAKYAPKLEDSLETAMFKGLEDAPKLAGRTLLVVDASGSMHGQLSAKSEMDRLDAAAGLAVIIRELAEQPVVYSTAGNDGTRTHATMLLPPRRGFSLIEAFRNSPQTIGGGGIFLVQCLDYISQREPQPFDRVIIFTDEQDCDIKANPRNAKRLGRHNYIINIASHKNGISYQNGWEHIDGWSEGVVRYIQAYERAEQ